MGNLMFDIFNVIIIDIDVGEPA